MRAEVLREGKVKDGVVLRCEGSVVVLELSRVERRNALDRRMVARLSAALELLSKDPETKAIVLCGASPGFCAGSDLKELRSLTPVEMGEHEDATGALVRQLSAVEVPVLAAVEGFAIGGGMLLACACDLVVASATSRWHLPEVGLGWVPPWGLGPLVDRVGRAAALGVAWGIEVFTGQEARDAGLVDVVVPAGEAVEVAMAKAERLAGMPPAAVRGTKAALSLVSRDGSEQLDRLCGESFADMCGVILEMDRGATRGSKTV